MTNWHWLKETPNEGKIEKAIKNFITYFEPPNWVYVLIGFLLGILFMYLYHVLLKTGK
jgi:preprotein translocase subunit SecY